jgi:co-chaperonin GroES (HSP10)
MLIVTRDMDIGVYSSKDGKVTLYLPGNERIRAQSGVVHIHSRTEDWCESPLTGKRILFSKYTEREFRIGGRLFCTVDERDVLAVFSRSTPMKKATFLEEITRQLGSVEGEDLSGNDLTQLADEVTAWAEDELGIEDEDPDDDETEEKAE